MNGSRGRARACVAVEKREVDQMDQHGFSGEINLGPEIPPSTTCSVPTDGSSIVELLAKIPRGVHARP